MTKELEEKMEEKEYKKTSKYEWTENNGEEFDPMIEKMSMEELEESMEELEKIFLQIGNQLKVLLGHGIKKS